MGAQMSWINCDRNQVSQQFVCLRQDSCLWHITFDNYESLKILFKCFIQSIYGTIFEVLMALLAF